MEEKNRRRNTGFVCFMRRDDAEEAMEACDETDPFNNGRQIILRWGKSVKKVKRDDSEKPFGKKRQRESVDSIKNRKDPIAPTPPISSKSSNKHNEGSTSDGFPTKSENQALNVTSIPEMKIYDPKIHASRAILVEIPSDQSRFHFISTAASYVAKDPEIEQRLKDEEGGNPLFDFLMPWGDSDELEKEKVFYRWRVYSFCQGDTYSIWRTEPVRFILFKLLYSSTAVLSHSTMRFYSLSCFITEGIGCHRHWIQMPSREKRQTLPRKSVMLANKRKIGPIEN